MEFETLEEPQGDDIALSPVVLSGTGDHAVENGCVNWRTRRTSDRFFLSLVVAFIIIGAVVITCFIMIPHSSQSDAIQQPHDDQNLGVQQVCNTSDCVFAAKHLRLGMNQTANPCDDFYEYACGNWGKLSTKQGLDYNDHFSQIQKSETKLVKEILLRQPDSVEFKPAKMASIFLHQCLNKDEVFTQDNINTVMALAARLGGFPSLEGPDWNENAFDLVTAQAFVSRESTLGILISVNLAPDEQTETDNVIKLEVPYFDSEEKLGNESYTAAVKLFYTNVLCEVIRHKSGSGNCSSQSSWLSMFEKDADDLIELQKELTQAATTNPKGHSDNANKQEIFTVEEFQEHFDKSLGEYSEEYLEDAKNYDRARISWKGFFSKIFGTLGVEINENQKLIVTNPSYFISLAKILARTSKRTIANYVLYYLTFQKFVQASGKLYELASEFSLKIGEPVNSRKVHCISIAMNNFAIPVMHEYLKAKSSLEGREVLEEMAGNFRATFDKLLENNFWLTDETKLAVRKKLGALKFFIGYPYWLLNATEIGGRFIGFPMGSNFVESLINSDKKSRAENLQDIRKSPEAFEDPWFQVYQNAEDWTLFGKYEILLPSDVGPFYQPLNNFLVIPMGFIQPHQFYSNVPSYVIYSRAGYVLGHEILHGFDADNKDLDENGQKDKTWTAKDELKYEEHAKCYRDQYNKFELFPETYLNGSFVLDENIADNDGLKLAYLTYKDQLNAHGGGIDHQSLTGFETLSTEQMFFLSYGSGWCEHAKEETLRRALQTDVHSPRKFRVNGVLQNFPEFAHAWNCPAGAPMNPVKKCSLW